ncbi:MAG TPA: hypothetical protein VGQ99_07760 [Tepidisphaeraceae bacterium]|jgi:hypothetical protein|nr:hypothetical protein [Tepidisphaeraceae bacterium]
MLSNDQKRLGTTVIAVIIGCVIAWFLLVDRSPPTKTQPQVAQQPGGLDLKNRKQPLPGVVGSNEEQTPRPLPPPVAVIKPQPRPMAVAQPLERPAPRPQTTPLVEEIPTEDLEPLPPPEPVVPVQVARFALGFVGADPQAEEVWYEAINDPNMSPKARQDLIEDLNEDGFPDPRNITEDDLPLIYNRIALIEQVAPDAMDDVNAAAFAEAYKDLVNMLARLEQEALAREQTQATGEDLPISRRPGRR